eukprot:TRINITY_DN6643_c0_g1_i1.p1 TRINITY_DN6643_c0_g1~~TRINITY_DN6643_c0_g1_i1.p1  ORF type:complete len:434 (-),score=96.68 TRINITY_DN6643_c0_g1_i1:64-1365(-)
MKEAPEKRAHWPAQRESYLSGSVTGTLVNFAFLFALVFLAGTMWDFYNATGVLLDTSVFHAAIVDVYCVMVVNLVFLLYCGLVYLLVKCIALDVLIHGFGTLAYTLYSFLQTGVILGPIALLYVIDPQWSVFAGFAVPMQCAVYSMKIHSFFFTHRHVYEFLMGLNDLDRDIGDKKRLGLKGVVRPSNPNRQEQHKRFRQVLSFTAFVKFLAYPTLCYYLEYPLAPRVRISRVLLNFTQCVVAYGMAYVTLAHSLLPVWRNVHVQGVPYTILKGLIPGFVMCMALAFGLFHATLNLIAEVLRYADRRFYEAWWEAKDMQSWWSEWNCVVADWMRRHVYFQAMQDAGFGQAFASFCVFAVSGLWHEFVLFVALRRFRPLMLSLVVAQISLIKLTATPFFKNNGLGNFIVLFNVLVGYPLVLTAYMALCSDSIGL